MSRKTQHPARRLIRSLPRLRPWSYTGLPWWADHVSRVVNVIYSPVDLLLFPFRKWVGIDRLAWECWLLSLPTPGYKPEEDHDAA